MKIWTRIRTIAVGISLGAILFFTANATTFYVDVNSTNPTPPYAGWSTAATDIQSAIDTSVDGDLILVTNGIYQTGGRVVYGMLTNRVAINKAVTVQSVNGPAVTEIQGYQIPAGTNNIPGYPIPAGTNNDGNNVRCVYLTNNAVLNGFTLFGGATSLGGGVPHSETVSSGGGAYCETTNAILTNCIVSGNSCGNGVPFGGGGGVFQGTLYNCVLSNNAAPIYGVSGGAAYQSVLNSCLIISNSSTFGGGAADSILNNCRVINNRAAASESTSFGGGIIGGTAYRCLISGNFATTEGGGNYYGTLTDCILSNNAAIGPLGGYGGGSAGGILNNCLVINNIAFQTGGGIYHTLAVTNCTIIGNTATNLGGGVSGVTLKNCIITGNYTGSPLNKYPDSYQSTLLNCWANDPLFVNPAAGDFHLQSDSPCINAGNNAYVSTTTDLDGNPRIVGGTVDIGAYEYQTPTSIISYAWLEQYGLSIDGSADFADPDHDGMNNWQEWIAGTNPTNASSVLTMFQPAATNVLGGLTVSWQSVSNRTYFLQSSTNLIGQPAFTSIQSNIVGNAGMTSVTDTTATNAGPYFYRVGIQ